MIFTEFEGHWHWPESGLAARRDRLERYLADLAAIRRIGNDRLPDVGHVDGLRLSDFITCTVVGADGGARVIGLSRLDESETGEAAQSDSAERDIPGIPVTTEHYIIDISAAEEHDI